MLLRFSYIYNLYIFSLHNRVHFYLLLKLQKVAFKITEVITKFIENRISIVDKINENLRQD